MKSDKDFDTEERLSRISTRWSMVSQAHAEKGDLVLLARSELLQRYRRAVYRYLRGATKSGDVAEDLCQEFAVKLLEGRYKNVDSNKGRFRDYLKTSLINLVTEYHRRRAKEPARLPLQVSLPCTEPVGDGETEFDREWREEVLNQTWESLFDKRPVYFALLKLRVDNPTMTSRELAEAYHQSSQVEVTPAYVRKVLERAHGKYASLMLDQVAASIDEPDFENLKAELDHLDLTRYCRSALAKWQEREARKKS